MNSISNSALSLQPKSVIGCSDSLADLPSFLRDSDMDYCEDAARCEPKEIDIIDRVRNTASLINPRILISNFKIVLENQTEKWAHRATRRIERCVHLPRFGECQDLGTSKVRDQTRLSRYHKRKCYFRHRQMHRG